MPERRYATPKKRVIYRIGVHTLPDRFCAATKIITNKASVHIQEQLWRRDIFLWRSEASLRRVELYFG